MKWFGKSWKAPICKDERHVDVPIGRPCMACQKPIGAEDQGFMVPHLAETTSEEPWHLDCLIQSIGVKDLERPESCH